MFFWRLHLNPQVSHISTACLCMCTHLRIFRLSQCYMKGEGEKSEYSWRRASKFSWTAGPVMCAHGDTIFPKRAFPGNITVFTCVFLFEQGLCAIDFCEAGHRWKTGLYASKQASQQASKHSLNNKLLMPSAWRCSVHRRFNLTSRHSTRLFQCHSLGYRHAFQGWHNDRFVQRFFNLIGCKSGVAQ